MGSGAAQLERPALKDKVAGRIRPDLMDLVDHLQRPHAVGILTPKSDAEKWPLVVPRESSRRERVGHKDLGSSRGGEVKLHIADIDESE